MAITVEAATNQFYNSTAANPLTFPYTSGGGGAAAKAYYYSLINAA